MLDNNLRVDGTSQGLSVRCLNYSFTLLFCQTTHIIVVVTSNDSLRFASELFSLTFSIKSKLSKGSIWQTVLCFHAKSLGDFTDRV